MSATTEVLNLRAELVLRVNDEHMVSVAATNKARGGEMWRCRCGVAYSGAGAIKNGRRHVATEVVAALDAAAGVA